MMVDWPRASIDVDWFPVRDACEMLGRLIPGSIVQADWFPVRVRWLSVRGLRLVLIGSRFEGLLSAGFRADWFPEPEPNPEPGTESDDLGADWLTEPGAG